MGDIRIETYRSAPPPAPEELQQFRTGFFGARAALNVIREAPACAQLVALFRAVPRDALGIAGNAGVGVGAIFSTVEMGTTAYAFARSRKDLTHSRDIMRSAREGHKSTSISIKRWHADLSKSNTMDDRSEQALKETAILKRNLCAALDFETHNLRFPALHRASRQSALAFLRDSVFQGVDTGTRYARIVKWLFPCAAVNVANATVIGSAMGVASGAVQIVQGAVARREANAVMTASAQVLVKAKRDHACLSFCKTSATTMEFLLDSRPGDGELAFGKTQICAEEAAQTALVAQLDRPDRETRYTQHLHAASSNSMQRAGNAIDSIFRLVTTNEIASCTRAANNKRVANKRIAFGILTAGLGIVGLVLLVSGVGTLPVLVILAVAPVIMMAATAVWNAYSAYRGKQDLNRIRAAGTKAGQAATASVDRTVGDIVTLLQDRRPESALARKTVKATLRSLGVSRTALQTMKLAIVHADKLNTPGTPDTTAMPEKTDKPKQAPGTRDIRRESVQLVAAQVRNVLTGDGARNALKKKTETRTAPRPASAPMTSSVTVSAS